MQFSKSKPKRNHYLVREENTVDGMALVRDIVSGDQWGMPKAWADALFHLDGRTPVSKALSAIPEKEHVALIKEFEERGMVTKRNIHRPEIEGIMVTIPLYYSLRSPSASAIKLAKSATLLLEWIAPVLMALSFVYSFFISPNPVPRGLDMDLLPCLVSIYICVLTGALFHELGHYCAGISYYAKTVEAGMFLIAFLLPGGYVIQDDKYIAKRPLNHAELFLAGGQANGLLSAICLFLSTLVPETIGCFFEMASAFDLLTFLENNCSIIPGIDGRRALKRLMDYDSEALKVWLVAGVFFFPIAAIIFYYLLAFHWMLFDSLWLNIIVSVIGAPFFAMSFANQFLLFKERISEYRKHE